QTCHVSQTPPPRPSPEQIFSCSGEGLGVRSIQFFNPFSRVAILRQSYGPGVGATEQPLPFCQFWMLMETVLTLLPVTVTYVAPLESLATVKLLICAPLPLSVCVSLMQFVTLSLRPPYHLTVLLTVESEPFITDHIAPRRKPV